MKTKELSGNQLGELQSLIADIKQAMFNYSHVTDYVPNSFKNELLKVEKSINKELIKRENEF